MIEDTAPSSGPDPSILSALATLKPKDFAKSCGPLAKVLKIRVKDLEALVGAARSELQAAETLPFVVHLPAEEPVDLASVLSGIADVIRRYIIVEPEQADCMALWAAHTHVYDTGEHSPLLIVDAPERACGKTLVQEVIARFAQRSMMTANATQASLFRAVDCWRPTQFFDEADTFVGKNTDLHGLINAGHKRGGNVLRTEAVGDSFEVKVFNVFCPKSIAGIALGRVLPDAMMSRGVIINMRRKLPDERVERWREVDRDHVTSLARGLAWMGANLRDQIERARPSLPDELGDRDQDNWQPLLAIAQCAGAEWEARAIRAAKAISGKAMQSDSVSHELLRDAKVVIEEYEATLLARPDRDKSLRYIATADLHEALTVSMDFGWGTYNRGEPMTFKQLAKQLGPYGIRPKTVRIREGLTPKGYEVRLLKDAFSRYLKDDEVEDLVDAGGGPGPCEDPPQPAPVPPPPDAAY